MRRGTSAFRLFLDLCPSFLVGQVATCIRNGRLSNGDGLEPVNAAFHLLVGSMLVHTAANGRTANLGLRCGRRFNHLHGGGDPGDPIEPQAGATK
jgi:hypothetical protein